MEIYDTFANHWSLYLVLVSTGAAVTALSYILERNSGAKKSVENPQGNIRNESLDKVLNENKSNECPKPRSSWSVWGDN